MGVTQAQFQELAGVVAAQAESIAAGRIPVEDYQAKIALILNNVTTLSAWAGTGPEGQSWHMIAGSRHDMRTAREVAAGDSKCIESGEHRASARHTPGDCPLNRS